VAESCSKNDFGDEKLPILGRHFYLWQVSIAAILDAHNHGRRRRGAVAPLDFHTWYRSYSR